MHQRKHTDFYVTMHFDDKQELKMLDVIGFDIADHLHRHHEVEVLQWMKRTPQDMLEKAQPEAHQAFDQYLRVHPGLGRNYFNRRDAYSIGAVLKRCGAKVVNTNVNK